MSDWLARIAGIRGIRELEVTTVRATIASNYEALAAEPLAMVAKTLGCVCYPQVLGKGKCDRGLGHVSH
jgi:hypothetical protein